MSAKVCLLDAALGAGAARVAVSPTVRNNNIELARIVAEECLYESTLNREG